MQAFKSKAHRSWRGLTDQIKGIRDRAFIVSAIMGKGSIQIPGLHFPSPHVNLSSLSVFIHWVQGAYTKIQDHFRKDTQENDNNDHLLGLREKSRGNFAFYIYPLCHCRNICHEHVLELWFKNPHVFYTQPFIVFFLENLLNGRVCAMQYEDTRMLPGQGGRQSCDKDSNDKSPDKVTNEATNPPNGRQSREVRRVSQKKWRWEWV